MTAYGAPARGLPRLMAWCFDVAWVVGLFSTAIAVLGSYPQGVLIAAIATGVAALLVWVLSRLLLLGSPGQLCWRIRRVRRGEDRRSRAYQMVKLEGEPLWVAIVLTSGIVGGSTWLAATQVAPHPHFRSAETRALEPFIPSPEDSGWTILPFFYSMGAWPKKFDGNDVLYSLPYAKGPPQQFVAQVTARWKMPHTTLVIEGPRTPQRVYSAERLRQCATSPWLQPVTCSDARELVLGKHVRQMLELKPIAWELEWFEVSNTAMRPEEQPRGFHIAVTLRDGEQEKVQERYILINDKGATQALVLDRPAGPGGELASATLAKIVRSLRLSTELVMGRSWVDRELQKVSLDQLGAIRDSRGFLERFSEIQALLVSEISVDPRNFDAFFHLGGTSSLLARRGVRERNTDWTALAKPAVRSALNYVQDIRADDPRVQQLQALWVEIKDL